MLNYEKVDTPKRWDVVHFMKSGHSLRETAQNLILPKSTVHHIWSKFQELGHVKDKRRSGRPKKLDDRDVRRILREINGNPLQTVKELIQNYNLTKPPQIQISRSTGQKLLIDNKLISRRLQNKWNISKKNVKLRLKWAKDHLQW